MFMRMVEVVGPGIVQMICLTSSSFSRGNARDGTRGPLAPATPLAMDGAGSFNARVNLIEILQT